MRNGASTLKWIGCRSDMEKVLAQNKIRRSSEENQGENFSVIGKI